MRKRGRKRMPWKHNKQWDSYDETKYRWGARGVVTNENPWPPGNHYVIN